MRTEKFSPVENKISASRIRMIIVMQRERAKVPNVNKTMRFTGQNILFSTRRKPRNVRAPIVASYTTSNA